MSISSVILFFGKTLLLSRVLTTSTWHANVLVMPLLMPWAGEKEQIELKTTGYNWVFTAF